jgi:hypothetical protein
MSIFLNPNYWFNLSPEPLIHWAYRTFEATIIILLVVTIILALIKRNGGLYRGLLNRLYNFSLANTLIGLFIFFFNYEMIPFFTARFWFALWAIEMLVSLIFIIKKLKFISKKKENLAKDQELKKYLP